MIWSLVREQLRAQRRFVIATGVVLTLAMTVAAYGLFITTTATVGSARADSSLGYDKEWHLSSDAVVSDPNHDSLTTVAQQDAALVQALSDGSDVLAVRDIYGGWAYSSTDSAVALGGRVKWDSVIARGSPPRPGEVALAGVLARATGVDIGDIWTMRATVCSGDTCEDLEVPFTVSGIARSGFDALGMTAYAPAVYVAWDDAARVLTALSPAGTDTPGQTWTTFNWNTGSRSLDSLGTAEAYGATGDLNARNVSGTSAALVAALIVGLVAMAFAVGRAQAQVRTRWVATARTLGASRRQIVATTMLESTTVGGAAGTVGIGLGYGAAEAHMALLRRAVAEPAFPAHVITSWWAIPALLALALVLSAIVGAVPAFWASRVQPVAALKPVSDISEAEASRRVSARPLALAWVIANVVLIVAALFGAPGAVLAVAVVAAIVVVVAGIMLMHEALRWAIPRIGARLARSVHRARMMAGDALLARPRQATIPAFIVALGVGTLVAIAVPVASQHSYATLGLPGDGVSGGTGDGSNVPWFSTQDVPGWLFFAAAAAIAVTTVVTLAISAATATLTSREGATREALGATRRDGRAAGALAYGSTQVVGIALGFVVGLYAGVWGALGVVSTLAFADAAHAASSAVLPVLGIVGIAVVGAAIGAAAVSRFTPQPITAARLESVA